MSKENLPKEEFEKGISVIIPCYNHGEFLMEAVNSARKINVENWELIIVNDGSDDEDTLKLFEVLEEEGVCVIHQENLGLSKARNIGIEKAKYAYILPLDSDNRITAEYASLAIEVLDANAEVGVVYSDVKVFGDKEELRKLPDFQLDRFLAVNYIDACAVYRKEVWVQLGGYDEEIPAIGYEDWEFWINAYKNGWKFHHINQFLFDYRVRAGSMVSDSNQTDNRKALVEYITKKHYELYQENADSVIGYLTQNLSEIETVHFRQAANIETLNQVLLEKEAINTQKSESLQELNSTLIEKETEIVSLKEENEAQVKSLKIQQSFNASLNNVIQNLEQRLKDIEQSKLWKLKRKYHKLKTLLRSPIGGGVKRGIVGKVLHALSANGRRMIRKLLSKIFKNIYLLIEVKKVMIIEGDAIPQDFVQDPWQNFLARTSPSELDLKNYKNTIQIFSYLPKISVIMPVYNAPISFLIEAIESVINQVYSNWELCIADDCSTNSEIRGVLDKYSSEDARIKVVYRKENGHISATSNSALELATGEFVALLDHDDLLSKDALYQLVYALNVDENRDFIYSDEDKVDENGVRSEPHFKPDWCPDNFLARNYITHLSCLRKSIVDEIGGFRVGFEGSQDYDLFLRFVEKTDNIYHIPKILYHWRMHSASAAMEEDAKPYAFEAGVKALTEALERRGEKGSVELKPGLPGFYTVRYDLKSEDLVSIVIPTKDNAKVLETCLESVFEKSTYKNIEVIMINNNSTEKATFDLFKKYKAKYKEKFVQLDLEIPFNYSRLMNKAVDVSKGEYILLLNNDTEVISEDWIESMMEQSQRDSVGAVGAKLLYHNDTIQHAGVVIGLGGVAGHTFIGLPRDSHGYFYYITSTNNYSSVTAACLMVRKEVYNEVGGFNEDLAVEYNDVDFCLKLAEKGYYNIYLPYVELYHYESLTRGHPHMTKESYARHIKEIGLFKEKWQSYIDHDPCYNQNLTMDATHFQIKM